MKIYKVYKFHEGKPINLNYWLIDIPIEEIPEKVKKYFIGNCSYEETTLAEVGSVHGAIKNQINILSKEAIHAVNSEKT